MNSLSDHGRRPPVLKPYPVCKDSGIEELGKLPAHWEVRRLKNWLGVNEIILSEAADPEYAFDYVDIGAVETGRLIRGPERMRFGSSPSRARRVVRPGDTIVSTMRIYLKAIWHAEPQRPRSDLIASTGVAVFTPRRDTFPKFVSHLCQSAPFTNRVTAESVGIAYPAIAETRLATFEVCVPLLAEQAAIVRFLGHVDGCIRRYVRAKRKLIGAAAGRNEQETSLIEEHRTRLIADVVTGKIDVREPATKLPDADPAGPVVLLDSPWWNPASHRERRGARLTRREEGAYWAYATDEQRSQAGCIAARMQRGLSPRAVDAAREAMP